MRKYWFSYLQLKTWNLCKYINFFQVSSEGSLEEVSAHWRVSVTDQKDVVHS